MPRPRRRYTRSAPRRPMGWTHVISDPATVTAGGQSSIDLLQNVGNLLTTRGSVIKRILGTIWIRPGDASQETEGVMGIVYTEADAEAVSAVPDPAFDTQAPWRYWKRFVLGTQATGELGKGAYTEFNLDLKTNIRMRNVADALNLIMDNDDGTHTFTFAVGIRILVQR